MNWKEFFRPTQGKIILLIMLLIISAIIGTLNFGSASYWPESVPVGYSPSTFDIVPFFIPLLIILVFGPFSSCSKIIGYERGLGCGAKWMKFYLIYWVLEIILLYAIICLIFYYKGKKK